jgi:hypothetical protein
MLELPIYQYMYASPMPMLDNGQLYKIVDFLRLILVASPQADCRMQERLKFYLAK